MTEARDVSDQAIAEAAAAIAGAQALLITAGAGMGVDSGLPDFRGPEGFWAAYPPYKSLGVDFSDLARPEWFETDPALAWGFYGHRLSLYRKTAPHPGFQTLLRLARNMPLGAFVFTSNVDGQFQKAGFGEDQVTEVHGSIHWLQCMRKCGIGIFSANQANVELDMATFRAKPPFPACRACGALARPNILLFNDAEWDNGRSKMALAKLNAWLRDMQKRALVIVECGSGTAVPTVRFFSEQIMNMREARLVRINPRDMQVPKGAIGIAMGALDGISALDRKLADLGTRRE